MPSTTLLSALALLAVGIAFYVIHRRKNGDSPKPQDQSSFTVDLTELASKGKLEPIVGMDEAIERVLHVVARKSKNNPLLIGEPGVGKTAVVEGLAQLIAKGDVPPAFRNKRVLSLNLADLMSGTRMRGELEQRMRGLLTSLEARQREVILFIDELHMIEQARGSEGSLDIADILKPALSRGELQIIGATTWREYEKYLKPDTAIERRFQPILIEEPSRDTTVAILRGVKANYEKFHGVCIPDEAVTAAVDEAIEFIEDRFLPDKAFDVIDEACAKVALESSRPHAAALGMLHAASQRAKAQCGGKENPIVTEEDVREVAQQWHKHRTRPIH